MKTRSLVLLCAFLTGCGATNVDGPSNSPPTPPNIDLSGSWTLTLSDVPSCFNCGGNGGSTSLSGTGSIQQSSAKISASLTLSTIDGIAQQYCGSAWNASATGAVSPCCAASNPNLCDSSQIMCKASNGFNYAEQVDLTVTTGCADIGSPLGTLKLTGGVLDVQGSPMTIEGSTWTAKHE